MLIRPLHPVDDQAPGDSIPTLPAWVRGSSAPSIPERVGPFVVLDRIGCGGAGEVWAAHDPTLDRRVALKLVRRRRAGAEQETRLLREAHALAKLSHPNVVTVHDADHAGDYVYIAMELVEGGTLKEAFADPERTAADRLDLLVQAARGLRAAHALGLVHRDFKPANALLGCDGRVRVADFGLARLAQSDAHDTESQELENSQPALGPAFSDLTVTGAILGTPAYMSPEQRMGNPVTAASDQFSFCVVAWQALYGVHPLADLDLAAWVAEEIVLPPAPATAGLPASLGRVLHKGLRPEPADRHSSMDPILRALQAALQTALHPGPARRRRIAAALVGVTALAGVSSVALGSDDPCATTSLDWGAARTATLYATLDDDTPVGRAAAQVADRGLRDAANRWAVEAEAACRVEAEPACVRLDAASFDSASAALHSPAGREHALDIIESLHAPCDDARLGDTWHAIAQLRPRLAAGHALEVLEASHPLERAGSVDDSDNVAHAQAALLRLRAEAERQRGETTRAMNLFRAAYNRAERVGADALAADVAAAATALAVELGQTRRARVWLASATSRPADTPALAASVALAQGRVLAAEDNWVAASDAYREAVVQADAERHLSDRPAHARLLAADALSRAGRVAEAQRMAHEAVTHRALLHGDPHPKTVEARGLAERLDSL